MAEVFPLVVDLPLMQGLEDEGQGLFLDFPPFLEADSQTLEFVRAITRTETQNEASFGENVHECRVLDDPDGVVQRERHHRRAQPDPLCFGRQVGDVGERVGQDAVLVAEVMLGDPGDVEAERVGLLDLPGDAGVDVPMRVGLPLRVGM